MPYTKTPVPCDPPVIHVSVASLLLHHSHPARVQSAKCVYAKRWHSEVALAL